MRNRLALLVVLFATPFVVADEPRLEAELVFPLHPKHNHAPGIVECPNGDLLVSWYRGSGERSADDVAVFGASVAFGFIAWTIVAVRYVWPYLRDQTRAEALRPLLIVHSFRFVGLSFMIPGVVAPELSPALAMLAAVGDIVAAILALLALWALSPVATFCAAA